MSPNVAGLPAMPQYLSIVKDEPHAVAQYAKTAPAAQRLVQEFQEAAPKIHSAKDLLGNYNALKVVLGAYGLSSLLGQKAVVRDLVTQDPTQNTSLAAKSGNVAWKNFAKAFSNWSPSPLSSSENVAQIVQKYTTVQFEDSKQIESPGLGNALYFSRQMTTDTNLAQIMSDPKLLNVVETVAGFDPTQFGALDYDQQVRALTPKVNLKDFSTPAGIQKYAQRYLATLQYKPQPTSSAANMLSLYGANGGGASILSLFSNGGDGDASLFSSLF